MNTIRITFYLIFINMIYIYTLTDPQNKAIRYVGKTNNLKNRLKTHISEAEKVKTHKNNWIKSLTINNLKPIIEILDIVYENDNWEIIEKYWISQFKTWGFDLVNNSEGGENPPILKSHSEETKQKLSLIKTEFFKNNKHHRKGILHTKEHILKILETKKKNPLTYTDEIKKNMSDSHLTKSNVQCGQYTLNGDLIKIWDRVIDAAHYYNTNHIIAVCQNKRKTAKGFIWSFDTNKCEQNKIKN